MIKQLLSTSAYILLLAGPALAQAPTAPAPAAKPAEKKPAAPAAPPAGAAPTGAPAPAPELDAYMKGFEGSWKCQSKMPAGAMGPGSPEVTMPSSVKFKKDLNGFFWVGEYEVKKSKTFPGMKAIFYVGYDGAAKQFTITGVDSMGGITQETAPPAEGDKATFTGESTMMGKKMKTREVMGRKSPKEAFHTFEADMGSGLTMMGEDTCKR